MITVLIAMAMTFAGGIWLLVATVWPAPPSLAHALERLHSSGPPVKRHLAAGAVSDDPLVRLGRRVLGRVDDGIIVNETVASDLAVTGRSVELYAGVSTASTLGGATVGPMVWLVASLVGVRLPVVVPLWMVLTGAVAGFFVPRLELRTRAAQARADFRHALGAYLDVLVLLLAANHGPEGAMREAALAGNGPAFAALRRATAQAQYSGAIWDALDDLGAQVDVTELREVAAAGSLAGERGAAVRKSLVAKARSLRTTTLSSAEAAARSKSQAMFGPILLMGCGFIVFLLYPLLTNLEIG